MYEREDFEKEFNQMKSILDNSGNSPNGLTNNGNRRPFNASLLEEREKNSLQSFNDEDQRSENEVQLL